MKVVFELDLMDDPAEVHVEVTCGSVEDYERAKKLYPADPDGILQGERTYNGARSYQTTAWTGAKGRVDLELTEPRALASDVSIGEIREEYGL